MSKVYININGEVRDASLVTLPTRGRKFRDAWVFNGDVIEIDIKKARNIKIERLAARAIEKAAKAEKKAMRKALRGQDATEEDAEVAKFKSRPKAAGVKRINDAVTPEELDNISEDDLF